MRDPLADGRPGKGEEDKIWGRSKVKKRRKEQTLVFCSEYIIQVYLKLPSEASLQALQND